MEIGAVYSGLGDGQGSELRLTSTWAEALDAAGLHK
jgi:hypothetical protein